MDIKENMEITANTGVANTTNRNQTNGNQHL